MKRTDLWVGAEEGTDVCDVLRDVVRKGEGVGFEGHGCEGVAAVVQHALGKLLANDEDLGPQVEEHGVGLPPADEFDGVTDDASASGRLRRPGAWSGR